MNAGPFASPRSSAWVPGNRFELLENGEGFFPRVFDAIAQAKREVLLETFILFEDEVGMQLHTVLAAAGRRGVQVHVLVDGYGSPDLSAQFIAGLVDAGVRFRVFDPARRVLGRRVNVLRRMHRKIVVVDGHLAFIGGINYSADHLADYGPEAKQDYAVQVRGPIVAHMHQFTREAVLERPASAPYRAANATGRPHAGTAHALFVTRDNHRRQTDIERHYRLALRSAQSRVVIANAYFFPGYRFIRELRRAARRGVDVRLILQGQPDEPVVRTASTLLYDHLLRAGVRIYEYCERPLHGKVALTDNSWSTVGSSNLDPLSLSLNLEANVFIQDRAFNAHLHERLSQLMEHSCREIQASEPTGWDRLRLLRSYGVFHLMRWFPAWTGWLPRHQPTIELADAADGAPPSDQQRDGMTPATARKTSATPVMSITASVSSATTAQEPG